MNTLHIVNRSPTQPSAMDRCLKFSSKKDSLLLIEDGVYFALPSTLSKIKQSLNTVDITLYALEEDLVARGIHKQIDECIHIITYDGFVELTTTHNKSSSWY
jgi:tRNA 2-thiouridine synthesizing protein B